MELPEDLYLAIGEYLEKGLYNGYGSTLEDLDFDSVDYKLLNELRDNVYIFSGAKTYQQCLQMSDLVAGSETFADFKKKAMGVFEEYNVNWLRTEYNTAVGQATQAAQWSDIEQDKETFPYLRYRAVMDANTSEICRPLDGITLPVNSPLWSKYAPLNHFNCRCLLEKIDKYETVRVTRKATVDKITKELDTTVQPEFKMNAGKDGYVFSPKHPYFDVQKKDRDFARRNFDLPIPPSPQKEK